MDLNTVLDLLEEFQIEISRLQRKMMPEEIEEFLQEFLSDMSFMEEDD